MTRTIIPNLCACGCGRQTGWNKNTKRFGTWAHGHHRRIARPPAPLCACGCGRVVKTWDEKGWARFALGHNGRVKPTRVGKGQRIDRDGYVVLYGPAFHDYRHGQVKRARYVMERHLGRRLSREEEVHHINRIKNDDRIENLQVVSRAEHAAIHADERAALLRARRPGR